MLLFSIAFAWTPTPAEEAMVRAFSQRDGSPLCAEVVEGVADPVASLNAIVENVQYPPWAPMYAATCLIEHYEVAAEPLMLAWVRTTAQKGLARLVLRRTHLLEPARAARIQQAALAGPLAVEVQRTEAPQVQK